MMVERPQNFHDSTGRRLKNATFKNLALNFPRDNLRSSSEVQTARSKLLRSYISRCVFCSATKSFWAVSGRIARLHCRMHPPTRRFRYNIYAVSSPFLDRVSCPTLPSNLFVHCLSKVAYFPSFGLYRVLLYTIVYYCIPIYFRIFMCIYVTLSQLWFHIGTRYVRVTFL